MNEVITWISVAAGVASLLSILRFWMTYSDRITKAEVAAKAAKDIAEEAKKDAHEASEKLAILAASFSLYREQVAKEYIHREVMREVEDRLTAAIDRLGTRFDRFTEAAMHKN
jgi:biopolymer transport protein ExbB/TolQ